MKAWLWYEGIQFIKIIVTGQLPPFFYIGLISILLLLGLQLFWLPDKWLTAICFILAFPLCYIIARVILLGSRSILHIDDMTAFWLALVLLCGTLFADTWAQHSLWLTFLHVTALTLLAFIILPLPFVAPLYWMISLALIFALLLCALHKMSQHFDNNTAIKDDTKTN